MEFGLENSTRKKILSRIGEVVEEVEIILESCMNVEPNVSPVIEDLEVKTHVSTFLGSHHCATMISSRQYM